MNKAAHASPSPVDPTGGTPFKHLNYFEEADQDRFAGREDEIQEALSGVTRGRTYVVYGRSGLGKTSLLLAGLFPRLRQRGFHPLRVRVLESPEADLCAALATELQRPELAREMSHAERLECVPRVLAEVSAREPLLIVLDQFEEFFVRFREQPETRAAFAALLGRIGREHAANVRLVFCLRDDYYAQLADLRAELPDLTNSGLRLLPLTAYGTRQAIVRPLQRAGVHYDEAFISRLVDLLADWHYEPPFLQIVCTELYRDVVARRGEPVHLTREDLDRLGGVEGIVRGYFNRVTSGLEAERLLLVRVVLDALISSEHTRRTARAEDLLAGSARAGLVEVHAVLHHLTVQCLVRVELRQGERWYELLHERLVPIVEAWLSSDPDYARFRMTRHFVATISEDPHWREDPDWLLSAAQLAERVDPWKERLFLDEKETEFLLRSSIHARTETVPHWMGRFDEFGAGRTTELLATLLAHPDVSVRLSAALACVHGEVEAARLAPQCLRLALEDPDARMRRAAGSAFAQLARAEDITVLRSALAVRERRARAEGVMADLYEAGRPLPDFPRRARFRTRLIVRDRRVERNKLIIRRRSAIGALTGARMTLVWGLTLGLMNAFYWLVLVYPQQVTLDWPQHLVNQVLTLLLTVFLFIFIPVGVLIGWRVARRAGILIALHGHERWGYPTLRSGTIIFGCVVMSFGGLFGLMRGTEAQQALARGLTLEPWFLLLLMTLATAFLAWLMTWVIVALGSRCIRPKANVANAYLWAFLCGFSIPALFEALVSRAALVWPTWNRNLIAVLGTIAAGAGIIACFLAFIVICALAVARRRVGGVQATHRRLVVYLSRGTILTSTLACVVILLSLVEVDTIPARSTLPFAQDVPLKGSVWAVRDVDYFTYQGPDDEHFALSVHGGSTFTRLFLNGLEVVDGTSVVSSQPEFMAAVTSRSPPDVSKDVQSRLKPRVPYEYRLVREQLLPAIPESLDAEHWSLVTLELTSLSELGEDRQWQVRLEGTLPPGWRQGAQAVHVQPLLLDIPTVEKGACLGLFRTEGSKPDALDASVIQNREDSETVPPPHSRAALFLGGFHVEPEDDGHWSLLLTLSTLNDFQPQQCVRSLSLLDVREDRPRPPDAREPATLIVAVKLY